MDSYSFYIFNIVYLTEVIDCIYITAKHEEYQNYQRKEGTYLLLIKAISHREYPIRQTLIPSSYCLQFNIL